MLKRGNKVTTSGKNKIDGIVLNIRNELAWVQYGEDGMFIESFPVKNLKINEAPTPTKVSSRSNAARMIQSVSKRRLSKIQIWINDQREYLGRIYDRFAYFDTLPIQNTLAMWSTQDKCTKTISNRLLEPLLFSPKTTLNTPGYMYRKLVLSRHQNVDLLFKQPSSWSLNPLFAASFKFDWNKENILLRLPLKTPASKLYIGDTSKLLNSSRKSIHQVYSREAEVIVAPMRLEEVRRRELPLGTITGINAGGTSIKRLSTAGNPEIYSTLPRDTRVLNGYHASPPRSVLVGLNKQKVMITVIDVREISKNESRIMLLNSLRNSGRMPI